MKKLFIITGIFIVLALLATIIFLEKNEEKNEVNTIGIILPLTGNLAFMAEPEKNGFLLSYEDFKNERPEIAKKIKILFEDTQSNPQSAVSAAQKLISQDKAKILIIANTGPNLAIAPITQKENVLQIAFCMEPDIQKKHENVFRLYESATQEGNAILDYLNKITEVKSKRIGFLYIDQANFVKTVEDIIIPGLKNEKNKIFKEKYQLTEISFRPILTRIKNNKIDVLVLLGYGNEYKVIFDQMIELGLRDKIEIIGGWGFLYPQVPAKQLDGVRVAGPIFAFSEEELSKTFRENYVKRFSKEPNFDAAYAYTALNILLSSIHEANSLDLEVIKNKISTKEFDTAVGKITIINRELIVDMGIGEYVNAKIKLINH